MTRQKTNVNDGTKIGKVSTTTKENHKNITNKKSNVTVAISKSCSADNSDTQTKTQQLRRPSFASDHIVTSSSGDVARRNNNHHRTRSRSTSRTGPLSISKPKLTCLRKEGTVMEKLFGDVRRDPLEDDTKLFLNHPANELPPIIGSPSNPLHHHHGHGHRRTPSPRTTGHLTKTQYHSRRLVTSSIYHNATTNLWIVTIDTTVKHHHTGDNSTNNHYPPFANMPFITNHYNNTLRAFSYSTQEEAKEAAYAYSPPLPVPFKTQPTCQLCRAKFAVFRRPAHCRNCGICICPNEHCRTTWPSKRVPTTYHNANSKAGDKPRRVNICLDCDFLAERFRIALLQGNEEDVLDIYETNNVNLRCPLGKDDGGTSCGPPKEGIDANGQPILQQQPSQDGECSHVHKNGESMYPVHCAVVGGNLTLLKWLVDVHFCPIFETSKDNSSRHKRRDCLHPEGMNEDDGLGATNHGNDDVGSTCTSGNANGLEPNQNKPHSSGRRRCRLSPLPLVTSKGRSVLQIALQHGHIDIVRYLVIDKGMSLLETPDVLKHVSLTTALTNLDLALRQQHKPKKQQQQSLLTAPLPTKGAGVVPAKGDGGNHAGDFVMDPEEDGVSELGDPDDERERRQEMLAMEEEKKLFQPVESPVIARKGGRPSMQQQLCSTRALHYGSLPDKNDTKMMNSPPSTKQQQQQRPPYQFGNVIITSSLDDEGGFSSCPPNDENKLGVDNNTTTNNDLFHNSAPLSLSLRGHGRHKQEQLKKQQQQQQNNNTKPNPYADDDDSSDGENDAAHNRGEETSDDGIDSDDDATVTTVHDACIFCFEHTIDCVLTPCGHQLCCMSCGKKRDVCPICNSKCRAVTLYQP